MLRPNKNYMFMMERANHNFRKSVATDKKYILRIL